MNPIKLPVHVESVWVTPFEGYFEIVDANGEKWATAGNARKAEAIASSLNRSPCPDGDGAAIVPLRSASYCGGCGMDLTNWPTNATSHHCTGLSQPQARGDK